MTSGFDHNFIRSIASTFTKSQIFGAMDCPLYNGYVVAGFAIIYITLLGWIISITIAIHQDHRPRACPLRLTRAKQKTFPGADAIRATEGWLEDENGPVRRDSSDNTVLAGPRPGSSGLRERNSGNVRVRQQLVDARGRPKGEIEDVVIENMDTKDMGLFDYMLHQKLKSFKTQS
ncbi:hypothetical protein NM208_g10093 [Fusarium decemcellulare]|uniref:Uncharacterized protein n=1 Tax=Fusarium decemcellulare TaxID=57161 RepID=A0ACC1RZ59_9HYPO|nr:hypothetical protein NM208_g10093 [Fusarium decemcellulare]